MRRDFHVLQIFAPNCRMVNTFVSMETSFNTFLSTLESYGYKCPIVPYKEWRTALEEYVKTRAQTGSRTPFFPFSTWLQVTYLPIPLRSSSTIAILKYYYGSIDPILLLMIKQR